MTEPIVSITDVFPEAVKATADTIKVGDTVFDVFGGKHKVAKVRRYKHVTVCVRSDGDTFSVPAGSTITVIPKGATA
jgi:hypothetical protein